MTPSNLPPSLRIKHFEDLAASASKLRLLCGELSPQEMRTAKALLNYVGSVLKKDLEAQTHSIQAVEDLEFAILAALQKNLPSAESSDSYAIPLYNALERDESELDHACETLRLLSKKYL